MIYFFISFLETEFTDQKLCIFAIYYVKDGTDSIYNNSVNEHYKRTGGIKGHSHSNVKKIEFFSPKNVLRF